MNRLKTIALTLFACLNIVYGSMYSNMLQTPPTLSEEEINSLTSDFKCHMAFAGESNETFFVFVFIHEAQQTKLRIEIVDAWPAELGEELKTKFTEASANNTTYWFWESEPFIAPIQLTQKNPTQTEAEQPDPAQLKAFAHWIGNKKIAFYTGAGISATAVPTLAPLMSKMGIQPRHWLWNETICQAVANAQPFLEIMHPFFIACAHSNPTQAHAAIKEICELKNWGLITENVDLLHQKTGIRPIARQNGRPDLASQINDDELGQLDCLVVVGQSCDNSGILQRFQQENPKGHIISFNINPSVTGVSDDKPLNIEWVPGDVQITLPMLLGYLRAQQQITQ